MEIIEIIKLLQQGYLPPIDTIETLVKHKCYYLTKEVCKKSSAFNKDFVFDQLINKISILERYKACANIFSAASRPYAIIKGAVLSQRMYKDPYIRHSGDIDFLISKQDTDYWKQLFEQNGFIQARIVDNRIIPFNRYELIYQSTFTHQIAPYVKYTGNILAPYINADVNTDILWGESEFKTDMEYVLSFVKKETFLDYSIYKLSPEMEFITLCLHHYRDMNSIFLLLNGSLRLGLFCEIFDYLHNVFVDPQLLFDICQRLNVGEYVYVCLRQTQEIFGGSLIEEYSNRLRSFKNDSIYNSFGLTEKEKKEWGISLMERLFHPDLSEYILNLLSIEDKHKIIINQKMM